MGSGLTCFAPRRFRFLGRPCLGHPRILVRAFDGGAQSRHQIDHNTRSIGTANEASGLQHLDKEVRLLLKIFASVAISFFRRCEKTFVILQMHDQWP